MQNLYRQAAEKLLRRDPRLAPLAPAIRLAAEYVWRVREANAKDEQDEQDSLETVFERYKRLEMMEDAFERLGVVTTRTASHGLDVVVFTRGTYRVDAYKPDYDGFDLCVYDRGYVMSRITLPKNARSSTRYATITIAPTPLGG